MGVSHGETRDNSRWLKAGGAHVFQREDPEESFVIDLLVDGSTIGVRVTCGERQEFKSLTRTQIERAESSPFRKLIDEVIEASHKH
jgi:hypothetical protein